MTSEVWRVGVLFSRSGVTAATEIAMFNGTLLAIEEINAAGGVLGRPLEPLVRDPQSSPRLYRDMARQLLIDDCRILFGCYMSSTRKAVMPEVEALRGLLFYPTLYEGFEYSDRCFYTGAAPNQNSLPLARYMMENFGSRFAFVGSNYVFPYESNRVMADLVTQAKGRVVDEVYLPLEDKPADIARAITRIAKAKPDVVFSTLVGATIPRFYEAFAAAGFDSAKMPIASLTTSEVDLVAMPPSASAGHVASATFFECLKTPSARRFVTAFKQRFGLHAPVTGCAEAAYNQIHVYAQALALARTDEPEAIAAHVRGLEFEAPQGRIRIDPDNNHTELWPRVARVNAAGAFEIVWDAGARVKPDPYFVAPSLDDWSLPAAPAAGGSQG
ncbi:transporter substrate-binding domain-containing protein [Zavarzinia sp.]|uniref:transporter substrate-binding domain-containing protein n=1 Tax=Zavarzinia sp. TaxID=2027920 RepID=UPI0035682185